MKKPWETCGTGYEYAWLKYQHEIWTKSEFNIWFDTHCAICPYFSGYHCAYGE